MKLFFEFYPFENLSSRSHDLNDEKKIVHQNYDVLSAC